jgi:hypothetical protein
MAQAGSARERSWITEADRRELDDEVMTSLIVVDSREAVLRESGDVILSKAKIYAEVGRPSRGEAQPGVTDDGVQVRRYCHREYRCCEASFRAGR